MRRAPAAVGVRRALQYAVAMNPSPIDPSRLNERRGHNDRRLADVF
jgi:hypothetical protein